jgi:hypothetical protein
MRGCSERHTYYQFCEVGIVLVIIEIVVHELNPIIWSCFLFTW